MSVLALTPEQIELLRSLPIDHYPAPLVELVQQRLAVVELSPNGGSMTIHRTPVADTLLACIDSTREQALEEVDRLTAWAIGWVRDLLDEGATQTTRVNAATWLASVEVTYMPLQRDAKRLDEQVEYGTPYTPPEMSPDNPRFKLRQPPTVEPVDHAAKLAATNSEGEANGQ